MKWYLGMQIKMYKQNGEGNSFQKASPGFTSNTKISARMWNFEYLYKQSFDKIINDFTEFNSNGSGWILERVDIVEICFIDFCEALENITNQFSIKMFRVTLDSF